MAAAIGRIVSGLPGPRALILLGLALLLAGCNVVREDRTIEFSAEADSVGFQHGDQGVFVADKDGGGLKKVFQPDADVLATSTPLWSPAVRRMIFTTARAVDGDAAGPDRQQATFRGLFGGASEPDPAGELFVQVPVIYTCWLRDEASGDAPVKLFEARCDHVGYVAANLAVRWHPRGDRILYLDRGSKGGHALRSYDLKTKASRPIFPHEAPALIFDWSPDGEHLACVLGTEGPGGNAGPGLGGIWIGRPDADPADWWHVPDSRMTALQGESILERLRATRPAWTADGRSFAFVTRPGGVSPADFDVSRLWIGRLAERVVEPVASDKASSSTYTGRPAAIGWGWYASRSCRVPWRRRHRHPPCGAHRHCTSGNDRAGSPDRLTLGRYAGSRAGVPPETTSPTWFPMTFSARGIRSGRSC